MGTKTRGIRLRVTNLALSRTPSYNTQRARAKFQWQPHVFASSKAYLQTSACFTYWNSANRNGSDGLDGSDRFLAKQLQL
jgi:hypothetical protein